MSTKSVKAQGFSRESIRKVLRLAGEYRAMYMETGTDDIKICISTGNRKIGHVMNVSLMPMVTCANCKECMHFCYDIKACLQYPKTVISARMRNTCLYWKDRNEYFARIEKAISRRRKNKFFRWHVAGDIPDRWYLSQMVNIARNHPDFKFWTYTKNYDTVNEFVRIHGGEKDKAIPGNLSIMFSEWKGLPMNNPYSFPVFACRFPDEKIPENTFKCPGNCNVCMKACRGCIIGENTYNDLH